MGICPRRRQEFQAGRGSCRRYAPTEQTGHSVRGHCGTAGRLQCSPIGSHGGGTVIRTLVDFALNNKFVVLAVAILLLGWGAVSFHNLPVEAYPDIADNYVTVITQWQGRSAEEVEQQVTIPIEIQMAGMPHMTFLRSESIFGLSFVIMIFDDSSVNDWNRQKVLERLTQVTLPPGQNLQPQIGTDWSTTGQIYWYTLRSTNPRYDLMELRSIEDWVLLKQFKSVPNVV